MPMILGSSFFLLRSQRLAKCLQCVNCFFGYCTMTTIVCISKIGRTVFFYVSMCPHQCYTCAFINLVLFSWTIYSIISGYYLLPSNRLHKISLIRSGLLAKVCALHILSDLNYSTCFHYKNVRIVGIFCCCFDFNSSMRIDSVRDAFGERSRWM